MIDTALEPLFRFDQPIAEDPIRRALDRRVPWIIHDSVFSQQSFGSGRWPDQGWKLHVSATALSAVQVLESALDVLLAEGARFKVVGSTAQLAAMNAGELGTPQIGKFITVYPSDDTQAVRLAVSLDEATRGMCGPRVPTDRPLRPDSLVHYRYGALRRRPEAELVGEVGLYDLLDPAGRLTNDVRLQFYLPPPAEIVDPFEAAGVYVPRPERGTLLNGRFLVNNSLSQPARGGVFRAVDLGVQPARLCLLKEAWHDVCLDVYGRDARDWAANEERILSRFDGDPFLPRFYDSFELDANRYIAIEYIEGTSLDRVLEEEHSLNDGIPASELVTIGLETADALAHLHEIGIVFRDFKPGNVLQTPGGGYRLIDFGIACLCREDHGPALALGTPPFYPREQFHGKHPSAIDDVFAWGAVLHYMACGRDALGEMPKEGNGRKPFPRRPVAELRPSFPAPLAAVIDRAVAWERTDRFRTMRQARAALAEAAAQHSPAAPAHRASSSSSGSAGDILRTPAGSAGEAEPHGPDMRSRAVDPAEALRRAREVGDALCAAAEEYGGGLRWAARSEMDEKTSYSPDLYAGAAGIGLFLAELAHVTGEPRYGDTARGAARWLAGPVWGHGRAQHGLHCGEPGVAYFFLRLAELLNEPGYVTAAELRMRRLLGAAFTTADLIYGTTGTILALLRLYAVTGEPQYLANARTAGDHLVQTALPTGSGRAGCYWEVRPPTPGGAVIPYLGLLHGAAGMGLALARLAAATSEERYLAAACGAADMLLGQAMRSDDGRMTWPRQLGDAQAGLQAHCHGAGGIGQFFVWLNKVTPDPRYRGAAEGAARTVALQQERESRSCVCHGAAGLGNLLLDCYQSFADPHWLALASECGGILERFRIPERTGVYAMNGEGAVSPDLLLGYAGVGSFLLRLANAESAPEIILG